MTPRNEAANKSIYNLKNKKGDYIYSLEPRQEISHLQLVQD